MARFDLEEHEYDGLGARVALVVSRFNKSVVERLLSSALDTLKRYRVRTEDIMVVYVPGAFEIPLATQRLASTRRFDVIITLGAVIRGDTPHFEYVAGGCARGVAQVALAQDLPVIFGVLTVDSMAQAMARAGGEAGNKGHEAALAALEMATLLSRIAAE